MAEEEKSRSSYRRPLSLNDSHYRVLHDLSAPPKPSSQHDDQEVASNLKPHAVPRRRRLRKAFAGSDDGINGVTDDFDDGVPLFSGITDFDSSPEKEATEDDKNERRKPLRDISSKDNERVEDTAWVDDEPKFSAITDFESPSPAKVVADSENSKGGNIWNILNDLNSKLNMLSIDRSSRPTNVVEMDEDLEEEVKDDGDKEKKVDEPEYASAGSSFSYTPDRISTLPDMNGNIEYGFNEPIDENGDDHSPKYPKNDYSFGGVRCIKNNVGGLKENNSKMFDEKFYSVEKPFVYNLTEDESYLQNKSGVDGYASRMLETKNVTREPKVVHEKLRSVGRSNLHKLRYEEEEEEYNCVVLGQKEVVNRVGPGREYSYTNDYLAGHGGSFALNRQIEQQGEKQNQRLNKKEPKKTQEKLRTVGRSNLHHLRDEEDGNDCVILGGKTVVKEAVKRPNKFKKLFDPYSVLCAPDDHVDVDESSSEQHDGSFTLAGSKATYKLPDKIEKMLYPHQREGLKWLWFLHYKGKGGILGDDMGLGKTMQICGFLAGLFHSKLIKRALVVAPKTLLPHWIKELSVVGLGQMTREYFCTSFKAREYELQYILQNKGILLTTYDIVRNNSKSLQWNNWYADEDSDDDFTWDYMILDEGHLIKNPSTQRAKSLLEIPSAHRIVVSGTPIQNNLKELWALFHFCCPDLLGDHKWFKETYEDRILRGNDKSASDREKRIGSTAAKELRERIEPYFLRRLKNEVFMEDETTSTKFSKKNEMILWLRLTSCQRQLYEAFLQSELVLSAFDGSPLAALTILKKICDHPLLLTKRAAEDVLEGLDAVVNPEDGELAEKLAMHVADVAEGIDFREKHDYLSCKISFILALLGNLIPEGHKVLIFSQTRKMLNLLQESLRSNGYSYMRIDGTTKASDRVKIVDEFQEGVGAPIFLLTSQVGGLGLTLTEADRVIVVDPAWNPSTDNQSVDRAYRIGQKKDVIVYRLMTCGTVEEKIYRKQIFKGGLFKTATEHKEQIRYFSQQDLRELFSLPEQGFDISLTQQQLHEEHDSQNKMDESLEAHIEFLERQGIAGVSHHSLLFSKSPPQQVEAEEEEDIRGKGTKFAGNSSSGSLENDANWVDHAFKPTDVIHHVGISSPSSQGQMTESEIRVKITRLLNVLGDQNTISRLPDKGGRLRNQLAELNSELDMIMMEKAEVIDLDNLSGELKRVMNA